VNTINQKGLEILADSGSISNIRIEPISNGNWVVIVRSGINESLLHTARGECKEFADLNRLIKFLKEFGVANVEIKTF